jgi:GrpB-like predicted nucleotidyltransferase (UPF0157 family)
VKIEHVSFTSVANLGGKGVLDILLGASTDRLEKIKEKLFYQVPTIL